MIEHVAVSDAHLQPIQCLDERKTHSCNEVVLHGLTSRCYNLYSTWCLTKTKNWSGRNEVTETSGRLHIPFMTTKTNNLHTPRTTDYRHTRKDGWIQTELAFNTCKECHKTESLWNHTTTDHKEGEQLEDRRSVGASSCNSGDGTGQRVQSLMFMMMMMMMMVILLLLAGIVNKMWHTVCFVNNLHVTTNEFYVYIVIFPVGFYLVTTN